MKGQLKKADKRNIKRTRNKDIEPGTARPRYVKMKKKGQRETRTDIEIERTMAGAIPRTIIKGDFWKSKNVWRIYNDAAKRGLQRPPKIPSTYLGERPTNKPQPQAGFLNKCHF